ncbi:MAG: hypothetical protein ACRCR3_01655 [Tannerellaceae bacterium]
MSEQEARKYTSIRNLRKEIREDMKDLQLLNRTAPIDYTNFNFYKRYLSNRIDSHIEQLINKGAKQ